jgi:hypothetical protein
MIKDYGGVAESMPWFATFAVLHGKPAWLQQV